MEKFIAFVLSAILVIYLMGFIGKWLLRRWIYKKQKEFEQRFGNAGGYRQYTWTANAANASSAGNSSTANPNREGEVKIQHTTRSEKKVSGCVGDYVDYEEVEKES